MLLVYDKLVSKLNIERPILFGRLSDYRLKKASKLRESCRACDGEKSTRCVLYPIRKTIVKTGNGTSVYNQRVRVAALLFWGSFEKTGSGRGLHLRTKRIGTTTEAIAAER